MSQAKKDIKSRLDIKWLMAAMTCMVRPIVRFAIGRVSCNALVQVVRETYVYEAREYLKAKNPDQRVTHSALALLCGMDGRAIRAFEDSLERDYSPSDISSEVAIMELWSKDPAFLDADSGAPAELLVHGPHGTFQRLVSRAAGRAVTPQTALERLVESGNVELSDDEMRVRLVDPIYMPVKESEKAAIEAGSLAVGRLGSAVAHNAGRQAGTRSPWLQQERWSLRIPPERVEAIRAEMRKLLERHIGEVEEYLEHEESSVSEGSDCSVGVGWYYWESAPGERH